MSFAKRFASQKKSSPLAFTDRVAADNTSVCALWLKQASGERGYFIIKIDKPKLRAFERMIDAKTECVLSDYGEILYKGWTPPSDDQKKEFNEKFGLFSE